MGYSRNPGRTDKRVVANKLKQLLANTYLLYIQTQGAHWNVIGSNFPQLHTLFQTQYEELSAAIDVIAEHIRTYGEMSPGSATEFKYLATFEEVPFSDGNSLSSDALLDLLIEQHRATMEVAADLGDLTANAIHTQDLAANRIDAHEKAIWMLTSTRNKTTNKNKRYY